MMDIHKSNGGNHFTYISQVIMLYSFNLYVLYVTCMSIKLKGNVIGGL